MKLSEKAKKALKALKAARQNKGSTIVGVIAALVFITVVAAFMVKNTGAQAAASIGYASDQVMISTVNSGVVATESFLYNNPAALQILTNYNTSQAPNNSTFMIGTDAKNKRPLGPAANKQFFSSQLLYYDKTSKKSSFEVSSAKGQAGKAMKTAKAFYVLENTTTNSNGYGASSAWRSDSPVSNADNGVEVIGGATVVNGDFTTQNRKAIFRGEVYFNGGLKLTSGSVEFYDNVYVAGATETHVSTLFNKQAYFEGNAQFNAGQLTTFKDKAYFNGDVNFLQFNTVHTVFEKDVGINGNYAGKNVNTAGNVYLNGRYDNEANLSGSADKKFYYNADNLKIKNNSTCDVVNGFCNTHNIYDYAHGDLSKITSLQKEEKNDMTGTTIANNELKIAKVTMPVDPKIDIGKIPTGIIKSAISSVSTSGGLFDVDKLTATYNAACNASPPQLFDGHLVLKVEKPPASTINFPGINSQPGTFDGKVIFIIEDGAKLSTSGQFYTSGSESSTLIYAGNGNAQIEQFGSPGLFRGLIYIDTGNTADNSFNWPSSTGIEGAVHNFANPALGLGAQNFRWNCGNTTDPVKITFNQDVLSNFSGLLKIPPTGGGNSNTVVYEKPNDEHIYPIAGGFYFY